MKNPLSNLEKYDVILASGSPRRKQLLADLNVKFRVMTLPNIDESYPSALPVADVASFISSKKAEYYKSILTDNQLIITADTIVVNDGVVLGKPTDKEDAKRMIEALSGKTHKVITGVTILTRNTTVTFEAITDVEFAKIDSDEIDFYIDAFNPVDKAGAYGIQEWIGCMGVKSISGSYYNVMGLPLHRLYTELKRL